MDFGAFEGAFRQAAAASDHTRDYDRGLPPECYPSPDDPLYGTGIFYKSWEEEEADDDD